MDEVRVHQCVDDLDDPQWDWAVGGSVFASVGWLRTVETHYRGGLTPFYISVWRDDQLVGGAVSYLFRQSDEIETPDDVLFGRTKQLMNGVGFSALPMLVCGTVFGNSTPVFADNQLGQPDRLSVFAQAIAAVEQLGDEQGVRVSFLHILDSDQLLREALGQRDYLVARDVPYAVMDVGWNSYDGYLDHLPKKHRKEFQRQSNRNQGSETSIETVVNLGDLEAEFAALADLNSVKHNCRPFAFREGFFGTVKWNLAEQAQLYRASKGAASTGVCLTIRSETEAFTTVVGVDRSAGDDFTYFELTYRFPIAVAAARKLERVHYARAMYEVKRRRGCRFVGATHYYRPVGWRRYLMKLWLALLSARNERTMRLIG